MNTETTPAGGDLPGTGRQDRNPCIFAALVESGFKLLNERAMEDIPVAAFARAAGCSTGAFYGRFRDKDEFFGAVIDWHLEERTRIHTRLVATLPQRILVRELLENIVNYYWEHQVFWRAVLRRSLRDQAYWEPFRNMFSESSNRFIERIQKDLGRALTPRERSKIYFAFQTVMGTINIAIIHQPGPVFIGQQLFVEEVTRAFNLLSELDQLGTSTVPSSPSKHPAQPESRHGRTNHTAVERRQRCRQRQSRYSAVVCIDG